MKIAVLADIHGNLSALEVVLADIDQWQPDLVVVNGDIVNCGPDSVCCWKLIRERQEAGWQIVRGNHEDYVVGWSDPFVLHDGPQFEINRASYWTYKQMQDSVVELALLPDRIGWQVTGDGEVLITHASIWGNRVGLVPDLPVAEMQRRIAPLPTVFVTAHTHLPFVRLLHETLVVNVGSVGLPGDGDYRASYGRITQSVANGWDANIIRLDYDRAQTERRYITSGYLDEVGPTAQLTLTELRSARDAKARWTKIYGNRILHGQITVAEAVGEFLSTA